MEKKQRKLAVRAEAPDASDPDTDSDSSMTERSGSFAAIFGTMKGTVTILPGTNLTDPIDEDRSAAR